MRKLSLLVCAVVALCFSTIAQQINVTGGPGRVNNSTVIKGLPFTATVTGLNGTPQRWTVGIGDINNQLIFNTSSTTVSNAVVDRTISGTTAVISVGATNGRGVARFLTVQEPSCSSELLFLEAVDCSFVAAIVNPEPSGATNYSWSITPSVPFTITNGGRSINISGGVIAGLDYTVSVTITGGSCNGATLTETFNCEGTGGGFLDRGVSNQGIEGLRVFPNPVTGGELNLELSGDADSYQLFLFSEMGAPVEAGSIEKQGNAAKIGVSNLAPGTYYIRTISDDGTQETKRFRVE